MTDPVDEIISMSNDSELSEKKLSGGKHKRSKKRSTKEKMNDDDNIDDNDNTDDEDMDDDGDDIDDDDIDDNDNTDDEDMDAENRKRKNKRRVKKELERINGKKKNGKVNKKVLSRELQRNKLRQIRIALPYSVKADTSNKVIDYQKSEKEDSTKAEDKQKSKSHFYNSKGFRIFVLVVAILCVCALITFIFIKLYRYTIMRMKENDPLTSAMTFKQKSDEKVRESWYDDNEDDAYEKRRMNADVEKIGSNIQTSKNSMKGASKNISQPKQQKISSSGRVIPERDARGRFVKRNK